MFSRILFTNSLLESNPESLSCIFITAASIITDIERPPVTGTTILGIGTERISSVTSSSSTPIRLYSRDGNHLSN